MAFSSTFTPRVRRARHLHTASRRSQTCSTLRRHPVAVVPKEERAKEELQRLAKKLEELKAKKRALLEREPSSATPPTGASRVRPPSFPSNGAPPSNISSGIKAPLHFGRHGEGSRFMSFSKAEPGEYYPRIVTVLNEIDTIAPSDVVHAPVFGAGPLDERGRISFAKLDTGFCGRLAALPGSDAMAQCVNPVAIAVRPQQIADTLPVNDGATMLLVIDRDPGALEFDETKFFVWAVGEQVKVGWLKEIPRESDVRCLGKVVFCMLEEVSEKRQASSCWEEVDEMY